MIEKTTHLFIQNCFHVVFYILGTQCLLVRHPGKDKSFRTCILTVIFQIIIKCDADAQNSKSLFIYISAVSESILLKVENIKRKIQRIISDSCVQLKSRFNVDARAPSIPLLNFPFIKENKAKM